MSILQQQEVEYESESATDDQTDCNESDLFMNEFICSSKEFENLGFNATFMLFLLFSMLFVCLSVFTIKFLMIEIEGNFFKEMTSSYNFLQFFS